MLLFQELLIIFYCLWCRGTNPPSAAIYLINNMYDSICGCDVTSHDVSTLKGEILKEKEEREGLPSHCSGGIFPLVHAMDSHTFPKACLGLQHGFICLRSHSTIYVHGRWLWDCSVPHVQTSKTMGLLALGWLRGWVCSLPPHSRVKPCANSCPPVSVQLWKTPFTIFPSGQGGGRKFSFLNGGEVLKCAICISRKSFSEHGVLICWGGRTVSSFIYHYKYL